MSLVYLRKIYQLRESMNKTKRTSLMSENEMAKKAIKCGDEWEIDSPTKWTFPPRDCKSVDSHEAAQQIELQHHYLGRQQQPALRPTSLKAAGFRGFVWNCPWVWGHGGLSWAFPQRAENNEFFPKDSFHKWLGLLCRCNSSQNNNYFKFFLTV